MADPAGLGHQYLRDPRLQQMLDRYATYTGSDPRRAPGALATIPYVEQTFGAWHVPGGLRNLGEALAAPGGVPRRHRAHRARRWPRCSSSTDARPGSASPTASASTPTS